jgi:methyl-accepting chemotaxis protein
LLSVARRFWTERFFLPERRIAIVVFLKSAVDLRENAAMPKLDNQTIMLAIVAVTALAVLLQVFILLGIFIAVRKATRTLNEQVEELRNAAMPILTNTRDLITRVTPYVESTVVDVAEVAHGLREQTAHMETAAKGIIERLRQQSSRVDAMFSNVLDAVDRAGSFLTDAVGKPARQLAGMLASVKAVVESLRNSDAAFRPPAPPEDFMETGPSVDEDPFV